MSGIHGGDIYRNQIYLDFSVNTNPLGMPDAARGALAQAIEHCNEYPDMEAMSLRDELSKELSVLPDSLLFGNGASELFMAIVHGMKPHRVLIPTPSFYGYQYAAKAADCEIVTYSLCEENFFRPKENFIENLSDDIDLLFIANPNNPTGVLLDRDYMFKLMEKCRSQHICVVLDECFIEFCEKDCSMIPLLKEFPNLIVVRAFTKIYALPGVRLGYLLCSDAAIISKIKTQLPEWNLSTFAQMSGLACIGQHEYVNRTINLVKEEREFLVKGLEKLSFRVIPSEANFILFQAPGDLAQKLLKKGILIRDCSNYIGLAEGYFRIAVKNKPQNEILLAQMEEL